MSPRSKRKSVEKLNKGIILIKRYSRFFMHNKLFFIISKDTKSLIDESTETESENYLEFHRTKIKADFFGIIF
jgi:hypothetical protein